MSVNAPKDALTDMSSAGYDINELKAQYRANRTRFRGRFRTEGNLDEDGDTFEKSFDWDLTRRLLGYVKPYRAALTLGISLLVIYSIITPIFPTLIARAVDDYLVGGTTAALTIDERFNGVLTIVMIYLGLRLLNFVLRFAYTYVVSWLGQHIIFDIRKQMFTKIQALSLGFFDRTPVGRLITRITSDVDAIQQMLTDGIVGLVADVGLIIGLTVYMFVINWQLALITLAIMPLLFIGLNYLRSRIRDAYRSVRLRTSISNAYLAENLSGMKTVQLFNREGRNRERYDRLNLSLLEANVEQVRWFSLFHPLVGMTGAIASSLILYYSAYHIVGPGVSQVISIGVLIAFHQYSSMFFRPLQELSEKFNIMQAAMASSERIFQLLDTPEAVTSPEKPVPFATPFRGEVEFRDVWFAYEGEDWVLKNFNLKIRPGESVAFVGHTGAGKTTIINLVSRFYDVQRGAVLIDGVDVRDYDQVELRRHVGLVLQDPFLFSNTLKSNITLGNPAVTMTQVEEASRQVNAHEFISKLPRGYDTVVRERGAGFSTGQKQLIAFARVLVQNPESLLVLDEATANIDTATEELIQDALEKLMSGRTSIVIAHRLSTIQDVDRIVVMRKGELLEQGSHTELLKQNGYYRRLYDLQYANTAPAGGTVS